MQLSHKYVNPCLQRHTSHYINKSSRIRIMLCVHINFYLQTHILQPINELQPLISKKTNKLHGVSPRANYTSRATAAFRQIDCQHLRIEGATRSV
jgi:hypothetical protein